MRSNKFSQEHIKEAEFEDLDSLFQVCTCTSTSVVFVYVCTRVHVHACTLVSMCVKVRGHHQESFLRCLQPFVCDRVSCQLELSSCTPFWFSGVTCLHLPSSYFWDYKCAQLCLAFYLGYGNQTPTFTLIRQVVY